MLRAGIVIVTCGFGIIWSNFAQAEIFRCPDSNVRVEAPDRSLVEEVCLSSSLALEFLQRYGVKAQSAISIEIVDYPLDAVGHPVFGSYDSRTDQIRIMSMASITRTVDTPTLYDEPLDFELYRSVIAHEVTHALVQQNRRVEPITTTAQEYLAHATQLAILSEARRAQIIGTAGVGAWESGDVISDIYMAMALTRFAVKCYLHLTEQQKPVEFVQALLTAKWRYINVN